VAERSLPGSMNCRSEPGWAASGPPSQSPARPHPAHPRRPGAGAGRAPPRRLSSPSTRRAQGSIALLMWCGRLPDGPAATPSSWTASIERAAAPATAGPRPSIMSPEHAPSTEIRLDARAPRHPHHPRCSEVTPTTCPLPLRCLILRHPSPASRPFLLAALRVLRFDPDSIRRAQPSTKEQLQHPHPLLTGGSATDKERQEEGHWPPLLMASAVLPPLGWPVGGGGASIGGRAG